MVRGQFLTLRAQTKTLSMEELLKTLVKRTQVECEEAQRLRVSAANGQAALHIINKQWAQAADKYRDVLRWAEELKDSVKTDSLQRLHTLHNLAEVLQRAPAGSVPPTLRDDSLDEEAAALRQRYLGRALASVEASRDQLAPLLAKASTLKGELDSNCESLNRVWWMALLEWTGTDRSNLSEKIISELKDKLASEARNTKAIFHSNSFNNVSGLEILLFSRLEEMENQRDKVLKQMRKLELQSIDRLSQDASDCHLRPIEGRLRRKDRCLICLVHDDVEDYESLLFRMSDRKNQKDDDDEPEMELHQDEETPTFFEPLRRGTWADSEAEQMLKFIHQFGRKNRAPAEIQEGGSIHLDFLDACKKEFRQIRVVWRQVNDQASAIDELSMATLRLRLRLPHEVAPSKNSSKKSDNVPALPIYLLERHDVDVQYAKLQGDLVSASNALKRHMGHSLYLKNLEMAGYGKRGNHNPDPCPVCQSELGNKWSVLVCGHSFCMDCIKLLVDRCKG